jgi:hypothetical protein
MESACKATHLWKTRVKLVVRTGKESAGIKNVRVKLTGAINLDFVMLRRCLLLRI